MDDEGVVGSSAESANPDSSGDGSIAELAERLDYLTDLFKRRLADDRQLRRAYDELYEQFRVAQKALAGQAVIGMSVELALVLDRLGNYEGLDPEFAVTVYEEVTQILAHHGVSRLEIDRDTAFDPRLHEAVEMTREIEEDGGMLVLRDGYTYLDRVIRPSRVAVPRESDADEALAPTGDPSVQ